MSASGSGFDVLNDADLLTMIRRIGAACERVMAMPEEIRTAPGPKGACSPEEAGRMSAFLLVEICKVAVKRGLMEPLT